ncbi:hypothetical protein CCR94_06120 [Rhodoblastus sphagnicola]|uniref:Uncharacterized protein n=1 Tax=Rhodoblastus sphagnicola TaxID=333368 RepID=A0A2S6NCN5_9HYPH|nr:hypothetical protein [Rhodoblastus sphagnicola]MBB4199407.1 hypothetical protein [Rhodoblastus sphagnicola]PPQ32382.1 hypothetical protein CCR94_06120 [Rhodoblastus sphagnicola]
MKRRTVVAGALLVAFSAFIGWRMIYPPNYISISDWFALPIATVGAAQPQFGLSAQACGACHADSAHEWASTMHARVWDDPYFRADWRHEGGKQICGNCHTPLDRQQEKQVLGFHGDDRWNPVLAPNPAFDPALRQEGITCAACHVRDGVVYGPLPGLAAPHPTAAWTNPNEACVRCHAVRNNSWDSFLRQPPCGTVAEIERARAPDVHAPRPAPDDGYLQASPIADPRALHCVECHMPSVERALTPGGPVRQARRHLWRGGHDPQAIRAALTIDFAKSSLPAGETRYNLTLVNTGAAHDVPTGAPDRHLTVTLQVVDAAGTALKSQTFALERATIGRPFLIDLWDTRLRPNIAQNFALTVPADGKGAAVEAVVRYWLMSPTHRDRLDYRLPISDEIYRERIPVAEPNARTN